MVSKIPSFSELPLGKDDPPLSAWGLYGQHDQLGTLNRLTPDIVAEAAKEIKTGKRVSLDWPLDAQEDIPFFGRQAPRCVNDDVWTFNTQSSSQWDGLRHFGYQQERRFYNGATLADFGVTDPQGAPQTQNAKQPHTHGIGAFSEQGIVGRGVLLDWASWREKNRPDIEFEAFTGKTKITIEQLKEVTKVQGTQIKFGDVLFVRSGYLKEYARTSPDTIKPLTAVMPPEFVGVQQSEETAEWLWSTFSAVAGDQPAFEAFPSQPISDKYPKTLHEVLLAGWGMPIGEMFDLEALSAECAKQGRYEFFLSSVPCKVPDGVARKVLPRHDACSCNADTSCSPPNAVAIL